MKGQHTYSVSWFTNPEQKGEVEVVPAVWKSSFVWGPFFLSLCTNMDGLLQLVMKWKEKKKVFWKLWAQSLFPHPCLGSHETIREFWWANLGGLYLFNLGFPLNYLKIKFRLSNLSPVLFPPIQVIQGTWNPEGLESALWWAWILLCSSVEKRRLKRAECTPCDVAAF